MGAVFSISSQELQAAKGVIAAGELVVKITEYVEHVCGGKKCRGHSYSVLETEEGSLIVTEKLADGTAAWQENPAGLEERNSLAKVGRDSKSSRPLRPRSRFPFGAPSLVPFPSSTLQPDECVGLRRAL